MISDPRLESAHQKAAILAEALPYIKRFAGKTVVIKYGGSAMEDPALADLFAQDVVLMRLVGMNPVVVHGGGPQISELMEKFGKTPEFVEGRRVTDAETLEIARMAMMGKVNREIVSAINKHGSYALGTSGEDANMIRVTQRDESLGFVGDVESVDTSVINRLLDDELIPVIATIGVDAHGQAHNINADSAAGAIASAIEAEKLVYLTDVGGIYEDYPDETSIVSQTDIDGLKKLIEMGAISKGMIPKVESCIEALSNGVPQTHILDGRVAHVLLLEIFTAEGIGTMIVNEVEND